MEQLQRQRDAVNQSNIAGWQSWASRQEIMANVTVGNWVSLASINGGSYVWGGLIIQVDINNGASSDATEKKTFSGGFNDGTKSVLVGSGLSLRYLGRSVGLYGKKEFIAANKEGHMMDALFLKAVKNPELVKAGIDAAGKYAYENANEYNVGKVVGRLATGFTFAPLGALATIGDITYGVEKGRTSIQDFGEHIFYGQ